MTPIKKGLIGLWAKAGIRDLIGCGCALSIGLFAAFLPYLFNHRFYFHNDEETYFYPYFLEIGRQLRHGHWPLLSLCTFCGGNFSIDWQLALFNPVSLLSYWLIAPAQNMELVGLCFSGFYIVLLALGSYVLARSFGLGRRPSLLMSAVLATNNFLIFFYAGAWVSGLVSWCWFIWTWAALQGYRSSGRSVQLIAVVLCAYLTVTSGWPSTTILLGLLFASYLAELILEETICGPKTVGLALSGISLALLTSPALLPALLSFSRTGRETGFFNHDFLTPNLGDLLNASTFFHLPHMRMYNAPFPFTPLLYLAWFLFPLAPMLDGKAVVQALSRRWALGIFGAMGLLLLHGPELLGPVRYPIRFLPGVDTVLLLGFLLAATLPVSFVFSKWRMAGAISVVLLGFTSSVSSRPEFIGLHLLGICLSLVLTLLAISLIQRGVTRLLFLWLIFGVLASYLVTHFIYRANLEIISAGESLPVSAPVSSAETVFNGYSYYVGPNPSASRQGWSREFFFGAEAIYQGIYSINGETTLNPQAFDNRISDDLWTSTSKPEEVAYLFSTDTETGLRLIDLMRVNTLLLEKNSTATWARPFLGDQWKEVSQGLYSIHLERSNPDYRPTTLAWSSPGIQVQAAGTPSGESERLTVDGGANGGSLVFARLWWPGYGARLDGQSLQVTPLDDLFVKVSLPAHARGALILTFVPPGLHLGFFLGGLGLLLLGLTLFLNHREKAFREALDSIPKPV